LNEATRKIKVSHWGNIAVDEYFRIENIGPKVKGQYSRVDIDTKEAGKMCLRNLNSQYPYYIKGMYIGDYIGNISSTNALRTATSVNLDFRPRYPICGGWSNDWD
jgi:oligosaccharyltransferase complex subunit alpha (ribophorin I)